MQIATVITTSPLTVRLHGDGDGVNTPAEGKADGTPALAEDDQVYVEVIAGSAEILGKRVAA